MISLVLMCIYRFFLYMYVILTRTPLKTTKFYTYHLGTFVRAFGFSLILLFNTLQVDFCLF